MRFLSTIIFLFFFINLSYSQILHPIDMFNELYTTGIVDYSSETNENVALAWNESYRLMGFIEIYKKTGEIKYLKEFVKRTNNIMNKRDDVRGVNTYLNTFLHEAPNLGGLSNPETWIDGTTEYPSWRVLSARYATDASGNAAPCAFGEQDAMICYPITDFCYHILFQDFHENKDDKYFGSFGALMDPTYKQIADYLFNKVRETIFGHELTKYFTNLSDAYNKGRYRTLHKNTDNVWIPNLESSWGRMLIYMALISEGKGISGKIDYNNYIGGTLGGVEKVDTYKDRLNEIAYRIASILEWDNQFKTYIWTYSGDNDGPSSGNYYYAGRYVGDEYGVGGYEDISHAANTCDFIALCYEHPELFENPRPFNLNMVSGLAKNVANKLLKNKNQDTEYTTSMIVWDSWERLDRTDGTNWRTPKPRKALAGWLRLSKYDADLYSIIYDMYSNYYNIDKLSILIDAEKTLGYALLGKYQPDTRKDGLISVFNSTIYSSKENPFVSLLGGGYDYSSSNSFEEIKITVYDFKKYNNNYKNDELILGINNNYTGAIYILENPENTYNIEKSINTFTPVYTGQKINALTKGIFDGNTDEQLVSSFYNSGNGNSTIYISGENPNISVFGGSYDYLLVDMEVTAMIAGDFDNDSAGDELIVAVKYNDSNGCRVYYIDNPENSDNTNKTIDKTNKPSNVNSMYSSSQFIVTAFAFGDLNSTDTYNDLVTAMYLNNNSYVYISQQPSTSITGGTYNYYCNDYYITSLAMTNWDSDDYSDLHIGLKKYNSNSLGRAYTIEDAEHLFYNNKNLEFDIKEIISVPPLSKYGIEAVFEFKANQKLSDYSQSYYGYTLTNTHRTVGEVTLENIPMKVRVLSTIRIDLNESDFE